MGRAVVACAAAGFFVGPGLADAYKVTTEQVAELPKASWAPEVSWDGLHAAFVAREGDEQCFVFDGVRGPTYDEISTHEIEFSLHGAQVAYKARTGDRWVAVIDGREGAKYDEIGDLRFDWETNVPYYAARRGDEWMLVVDFVEGPACDWVEDSYPVFTRKGDHHAYRARRGRDELVIWDGAPGRPYEKVEHLRISLDANHIAYAAKREGRWFAVHDAAEGKGYEWVQRLALSADGRRLAYEARDFGDWFLVIDGEEVHDYEGYGQYWFSPDSQQFMFWGHKGGKLHLVTDGKPGPPWSWQDPALQRVLTGEEGMAACAGRDVGNWYDRVSQVSLFSYSSRTHHMSYVAEEDGKKLVVFDGHEAELVSPGGEGDVTVRRVHASADGSTLGYVVEQGESAYAVIGEEIGPPYDSIGRIWFSPNGAGYAYAARRGRASVLVTEAGETRLHGGGVMGSIGPESGFVFSPDSRHLAYVGGRGGYPNEKAFVVLDGKRGPVFNTILTRTPVFHEDGTLEYLAQKGKQILRVRHVPQGGR